MKSRRIRSLKAATLAFIARNISYWAEMIPEDPDNYLYLLGPFEGLDHGLTQELFDTLVKNDKFLPKHVHLLFHSQLDSIDLSKSTTFRLGESILKILLKRCKKIKSLKLSGGTRYSKSILNLIPYNYSNLESLIFNNENMSNEFIVNLVRYCPSLICFQSSNCGRLNTDSFLRMKLLTNLQVLTLGNADALTDDILLQIFTSCKKIKHISLPMTAVMFGAFSSKHVFSSIQAIDLTLSDRIDDNSVHKIVASCPNLKALCLSNCRGVTEESLEFIAENCQMLENLNISYCGIKKYSEVIKRFLISAGHCLHSVDFSGISYLRTSLFAQYCSHIEKLFLNHCPYLATEWVPYVVWEEVMQRNTLHNDKFLKEMICLGGKHEKYSLLQMCPLLNNLQIDLQKRKSDDSDFDLQAILQGGYNTKTLCLVELPQFDDDSLRDLENVIDTEKIEHLSISGNAKVTADGIWYAVESMKNLKVMEVHGCDIFDSELDAFKKKIIMDGYDVDIIGHK